MQNPNITAANIVDEITKQVKHYPIEPIYGIQHQVEKCYFEVLINDMPAFRNFDFDVPDAFEINNIIFNKGKNTVRYKLYPVGKNEKYLKIYNNLVDETQLKLSLYSYDKKNKQADDVEYMTYEILKIETKVTPEYSTYKFAGAGKTYYEGSFDIDVDVPYELHPPFENAQDLRKMDKKVLEANLVKEYKRIRNTYQSKEQDNLARLVYDDIITLAVNNYLNKEQIQAAWDEINEIILKSDIEILPIENYNMQFFANGRLVGLCINDTNKELRGWNALVCNVKSGNHGKGLIELKHLFYIPQGETEFKVY